jgi:predicted site-specific integrase-resolvase
MTAPRRERRKVKAHDFCFVIVKQRERKLELAQATLHILHSLHKKLVSMQIEFYREYVRC